MTGVMKKDYPLSMRMQEADLALIDRAARLRGRSRTEFVRDSAVREAEYVVMENLPIRMTGEGFDEFLELINAPAQIDQSILERARRPSLWGREIAELKSEPVK